MRSLPVAEPANCNTFQLRNLQLAKPSKCGTCKLQYLPIAEPSTCKTFQLQNLGGERRKEGVRRIGGLQLRNVPNVEPSTIFFKNIGWCACAGVADSGRQLVVRWLQQLAVHRIREDKKRKHVCSLLIDGQGPGMMGH
jgi:hypothetical protein